MYHNRTGCQWAFLPHDLLPKSTVCDYFTKWRDNGLFSRLSMPCVQRSGAVRPRPLAKKGCATRTSPDSSCRVCK
jgi:transposase